MDKKWSPTSVPLQFENLIEDHDDSRLSLDEASVERDIIHCSLVFVIDVELHFILFSLESVFDQAVIELVRIQRRAGNHVVLKRIRAQFSGVGLLQVVCDGLVCGQQQSVAGP